MTTPLPPRTAANDARIAATPYAQLTQRQKDYADMHGIRLQSPYSAPAQQPVAYVPPGKDDYPPAPTAQPEMGMTGNANAGVDSGAAPATTGGSVPSVEDAEREAARRDSYARLQAVLDDYGLGSLGRSVEDWLQEGLSEAEIMQRLRDPSTEAGKVFHARFPAIEERKRKGLSPLSPAEYIAYERQARQLFRSAGLPQGFYDSNDDFTKFLTGDVSLTELGDRVGLASNAAFNSDASVLGALAQFGITGGDLTAFFLDPDVAQPLLERKYNAARLSATGNRAGFGYLSEGESNDLLSVGVTEGQATQGLSELAYSKELYSRMDRGEDDISRTEQLDATFKGNANARRRIQQRTRRRQAIFEQGGSFAQGQTGITGLGSAET